MRKIFKLTLFVFCASFFMFGKCKKDATAPNNSLTAQIGSSQFNASGNDVNVNITGSELTITGESGNQVLTIAVANYTNATGTFHFDNSEALGGYDDGGGAGDDAIVTGTITITQAGSTIAGTFSGTTQGGTSISSGSFSVQN